MPARFPNGQANFFIRIYHTLKQGNFRVLQAFLHLLSLPVSLCGVHTPSQDTMLL